MSEEMNTSRVREIESCITPKDWTWNLQRQDDTKDLIAAFKEMTSLAFQALPVCLGECDCRLCKLRIRYEGLECD